MGQFGDQRGQAVAHAQGQDRSPGQLVQIQRAGFGGQRGIAGYGDPQAFPEQWRAGGWAMVFRR